MMHRFPSLLLMTFLLLNGLNSQAQKKISTASLLKEMVDIQSVTYWPVPHYTTNQASSYDRKSVSPDKPGWFANSDNSQFIRVEQVDGHKEYVMLDASGPGALVRFWLTTFKRDGKLRIYFDHSVTPEITIPGYDLMKSGLDPGPGLLIPHSSYQPLEKGGSTLYLPMPYEKHCKVTWEDAEPEIRQPRYYQINYRSYAPGTTVQTFTRKDLKALAQLTKSVSDRLLNPDSTFSRKPLKLSRSVAPQASASVELPSGTNAVRLMTIRISTKGDMEQVLRSTLLKIKFDGEQTVSCPAGDFSGSGAGGKPLQSWYRTVTENGEIISRWVMPYQKSASITIENTGKDSLTVDLSILSERYKWTDNSMYFHADYKFASRVPIKKWDEEGAIEWRFLDVKGKGIFLGDSFAVYNHMHTWYGEGDQKLYADNLDFPSEFGTGAEDYYNTSWAPVVLYQSPFANAPRADAEDSYGHNTFTRTRNLDGITFTKFFRYDLEMIGWANGAADCAATTYWYKKH